MYKVQLYFLCNIYEHFAVRDFVPIASAPEQQELCGVTLKYFNIISPFCQRAVTGLHGNQFLQTEIVLCIFPNLRRGRYTDNYCNSNMEILHILKSVWVCFNFIDFDKNQIFLIFCLKNSADYAILFIDHKIRKGNSI